MKPLNRLLAILRMFTGEVITSLLLGVAAIATGIGLLGTSAYLIASAALHPSIADLQVAIVGVRFFGISRGVFRYFERLVSHSINLKVLSYLREDFYRRVEPGAPANLVSYRSGDVLQRVMGDLETLENFYVRVISPVVIAIVVILGVSLFVGGYAVELGVILAAGMVVTGFLQPALSLLLTKSPTEELARSKGSSSARMVEILQGLEDIQSCNAQEHFYEPLMSGFTRSGMLQNRLITLNGVNSGISLLLTNLTVLGMLWFAIPLVSEGSLSGISLAVVTLMALASFEAVNPLPSAAQNLSASRISAQRLFGIGMPEGERVVEGVRVSISSSQRILLDEVDFSYAPHEEKVLEDISFELYPGRKIAVVGASGAGKTSLIHLLLGFQYPQAGRIMIGGVNARELDPEEVRSQFAVLPQSVYLFNGNLRENLLLAKPGASDNELLFAIEKAELSNWLASLPEGLDSCIGEHGVKMSGGERQRLAIARILLQDRPFVLLDEPTANLDQVNASKIMENLFSLYEWKGMLLITHNLDMLPRMDEILLIESARITEHGDFKSLVEKGGRFTKLYDLESDRLNEY